ncbi:unnamed protein product [Meganyctiphanes norvegica]|uniref:C2H2-type domain-containing protein n=1 Tax=Meganyctiphanes norvegica TaxID=48144 RepID=A0AAV2RXZ1_MEGNR
MITNKNRHRNINQENISRTATYNETYSSESLLPQATTRIVNNVTLDPVYKDLPVIGDKGECVIVLNDLQHELYKNHSSSERIPMEETSYHYTERKLHNPQVEIAEKDAGHSQTVKISVGENFECDTETELRNAREEIAALKQELAHLHSLKRQNVILMKRLREFENTLGLMKYSADPSSIDKEVFQHDSNGQFSTKADLDLTILRTKFKVEDNDEFINLNKDSEYFDDELNNFCIEENTNAGQIVDEYLNKCFSDKNTFQCRICNYHCRSLTMLENHMNIHSNNDEVNQLSIKPDKLCMTSESDSEIPDSVAPVTCIKIYTRGNVYSCLECDYQSKTKYDLQCHMLIHGVEIPYECQECGLKFPKASQLIAHSRTHVDDRPFLCSECGKTFISLATYKRHLKIHSNEKPYGCPTCEYRCYSNSNLKKHMKTHTGERPFACPTCNYKAIDNAHLKKHKRIHTGEKPYLCNECGKAFRANSLLKNHMLTHKEKTFGCETCGHKCTTKALLKRHVDNNHTEFKPFPCSECDWRFAEKSDLKRHSLIHSGEMPHMCQECGKRFRTISTLNQHKLTHQNTLFKCSNCDYTGKTKLSLRMHMRREHGFYARDGYKFTYIFPPDNT